jgi:hypothetical protein
MVSPEQFCDEVKQALIDGLPDALTAQTTAWAARDAAAGRDIPLAPPRAEEIYIGGAPGTALRFPAIEIAVSDLGFGNFSIQNFDGDASPKLIIRVMFEEARDQEWLYRAGCRWFAATLAVLAADDAMPELDIQDVNAHWRYDPRTNEADKIRSGVLISFDLEGPLSPFVA